MCDPDNYLNSYARCHLSSYSSNHVDNTSNHESTQSLPWSSQFISSWFWLHLSCGICTEVLCGASGIFPCCFDTTLITNIHRCRLSMSSFLMKNTHRSPLFSYCSIPSLFQCVFNEGYTRKSSVELLLQFLIVWTHIQWRMLYNSVILYTVWGSCMQVLSGFLIHLLFLLRITAVLCWASGLCSSIVLIHIEYVMRFS